MLKGSKSEDLPSSVRCLETRDMPAVFLRLQSAREQVALPYSSLIKLVLKNDGTAVELSYVTHRVMITGRMKTPIRKDLVITVATNSRLATWRVLNMG